MVFSKKLICLSLLLSVLCNSVCAMEEESEQKPASSKIEINSSAAGTSSMVPLQPINTPITQTSQTATPQAVQADAAATTSSQSVVAAPAAKTLHEAAALGQVARLEELLAAPKTKINELSKEVIYKGLSPLHVAIDRNQLGIVGALISHGADLNLYDNVPDMDYYRTPLIFAIEKGFTDIVKLLLDHGANVEKCTAKRHLLSRIIVKSPLNIASECGNLDIVRALLAKNASVMNRNFYKYPLHYAALHDDPELLRAILEVRNETYYYKPDTSGWFLVSPTYWRGLSKAAHNRENYINYKDWSDLTPLSIAAEKGNTQVVDFLVNRNKASDLNGALKMAIQSFNSNPATHMATINILVNAGANVNSFNSLTEAVAHGATEELIRLLVSHNASRTGIPLGQSYWIDYPLHEAADAGNLEQVKKLLHVPGFHANICDNVKCTPLHVAAANGHLSVVEYLFQQGADINAVDSHGQTPLYYAVIVGQEPVISFLCKNNALVDKATPDQETPLHIAAYSGRCAIAQTLLQFKANIESQNSQGQTPLLKAIEMNQQKMAQLLLDRKAQVDCGNPLPLEKAASYGQNEIVKNLLERHAKITARAIELAARNCHESIFTLLRDWDQLTALTLANHGQNTNNEDTARSSRIEGQWQIVPSLQQARPNGEQTRMCGYYALYNAKCLMLNQEGEMRNREQFCQFLKPALNAISIYRGGGPVENLNCGELNLVMKTLNIGLPIIVIEKSALFAFLSHSIPDLTLDTALEIDPSVNYLRDFVAHKIDKFVIIAGLGNQSGHWIAICVKRIHDKVVLKIADSIRKITDWTSDELQASILPFYLAVNNSLSDWPQTFNADILHELFSEFKKDGGVDLKPAAQNLRFFIDCIINLKNSLFIYLDNDMPQHINENQQILTDLRLRKFSLVVDKLLPKILAQSVKIKAQDPLGDEIISFYESVRTNIRTLSTKIKTINEDIDQSIARQVQQEKSKLDTPAVDKTPNPINTPQAEKDIRMEAVSSIAATLRKLEKTASEILEKINNSTVQSQSAQPAIDDDSFVSHVAELKPEFLELIKQSLPDAITGMIGRLTKENHDPVRALFVGPPGNGKTTIAQAIAQICHRPFHFIRSASLGNSYQFSRENQLKTLIAYMEKNPNAIILFDEIDALAEFTNEAQRAAEQLQSIIDLAKTNYPKVVFIGTTNYKDKIPAPLLSRLAQNIIEIPNPNAERRNSIIRYHMKRLESMGLEFRLQADAISTLSANTDNFSIRDLESLFENVQGQINICAGQTLLQKPEASLPEHHDANPANIIVPENMEQAYQAILSTIVYPETKTDRILAAALKYGPALPYIGQAVSVAGLGLSIYSTFKAAYNRTEDIQRLSVQIDAANTRQDKQIADANTRQDGQIAAANTRVDEQIAASNTRQEMFRTEDHEDLQQRIEAEALKTVSLDHAREVVRRGGWTNPYLFYYDGQYIPKTVEDAKQTASRLQNYLKALKSTPEYTPELEKKWQRELEHLNTQIGNFK